MINKIITWIDDWKRAREERKVFEALLALAQMEDGSPDCDLCDDDPQACICDDGPDCD